MRASGEEAAYSERPAEDSAGDRVSSVEPIGGAFVIVESERTRLIADIVRVMGEPSLPEDTRLAGMTLIGWLARRRPDESPHAIGLDEARESERRIRAAHAASGARGTGPRPS